MYVCRTYEVISHVTTAAMFQGHYLLLLRGTEWELTLPRFTNVSSPQQRVA